MANEAVLVFETHLPIPFIVADGTGISKGAHVVLSDPFTVASHSAVNETVGGVAAKQKIASDGVTTLAVYRGGIFKVTLSGSCTVGDPLGLSATPNMVRSVIGQTDATLSGSKIWGTALETGTTGQTILAELRPMTQGAG